MPSASAPNAGVICQSGSTIRAGEPPPDAALSVSLAGAPCPALVAAALLPPGRVQPETGVLSAAGVLRALVGDVLPVLLAWCQADDGRISLPAGWEPSCLSANPSRRSSHGSSSGGNLAR